MNPTPELHKWFIHYNTGTMFKALTHEQIDDGVNTVKLIEVYGVLFKEPNKPWSVDKWHATFMDKRIAGPIRELTRLEKLIQIPTEYL